MADLIAVCLTPDIEDSGNIVFRFKLPNGLALRSARIIHGIPELCFDSSPKVPTIQEEDVAVACRLAKEKKRPEFFYLPFPVDHPFHNSRWFMQYSPSWMRGTKIGTLLADTDWNMKCLHVGVKTDEEKMTFKSWPASSKLTGLGTHLDFPVDGDGSNMSIKMFCDSATVQKDENQIFFPEEPKMKIVDGMRSGYSKYITDLLPSVAYYDEVKFLKLPELIKLILTAEWLYEQGVRVNYDWMMIHTEKSQQNVISLPDLVEPPMEMIPLEPSDFNPPSTDSTVVTVESEMYEALADQFGVTRRYGYIDFGGAEIKIFTEDGREFQSTRCLKVSMESQDENFQMKGWMYLLLPKDTSKMETQEQEGFLQLLPSASSNDILPVSVSTSFEDVTHEKGMNWKYTISVKRHPPLMLPHFEKTTVIKATQNDLDFIFDTENPNTPLLVGGEEVVPGVTSWEELISELSVPMPRVWQDPYIGIGEPTAIGGVSTKSFEVSNQPMREMKVKEETEWKDGYKRRDTTLVIRSYDITRRGSIQPVSCLNSVYAELSKKFMGRWIKGTPPTVQSIFAISNTYLQTKWEEYQRKLISQGHPHNFEEHYHGTVLACDIISTNAICNNMKCAICSIACGGMDPSFIQTNIDFQRFGRGFYLAPNSSKCDAYTQQNHHGYKALLLCEVLPGRKFKLGTNQQTLTGPPPNYDSVYGVVGQDLNYPEIVIYDPHAIMPRFIIVYK